MELVSQSEYARRRGVSHTAVQKAIRSGRIPAHPGPRRGWLWVNPEEADRFWNENTDPSTASNSVNGEPKGRRGKDGPSMPRELDDGGNGDGRRGSSTGYARARAAREAALAQMAKLELDERLGKLVRTEEVRLAAFTAARKARDLLIAIPGRIAPILAAVEGDVVQIERLLAEEIDRICSELSGDESAKRE